VVKQTGADIVAPAELGRAAFTAQEFLNYLRLKL